MDTARTAPAGAPRFLGELAKSTRSGAVCQARGPAGHPKFTAGGPSAARPGRWRRRDRHPSL